MKPLPAMTEDRLEQETLGWLAEPGYLMLYGPDIAPDDDTYRLRRLNRSTHGSVRAKPRLMVKRILHKDNYPPDRQEAAIEPVLRQAEALGDAWSI